MRRLAASIAIVLALAAAQTAQADTNWLSEKDGGSEESPYNIWETANWDGSIGSGNHLNLSVSEKTYFKSESDERIGNDFRPNSGDFVFLGPLTFKCLKNNIADASVSVLKKGDWMIQDFQMYIGYAAGSTMSFTNETGNVTVTGSRGNLYIADREGSTGEVVKESGDWSFEKTAFIGNGKDTTARFYNRGGNLAVADDLAIAQGEGSSAEIVKESGDWSASSTVYIGNGKNSIATFYNRGGSLTAARYGVCLGENASGTTGSVYLEISGGAVTNTAGNFSIGDGNCDGTAEVLVNGGEYCAKVGSVQVGNRGRGTLTIDSGRVIAPASGVIFCSGANCVAGRDCFLNLNGGTLETKTVTYGSGSANATFTFNGGTLKALQAGTLIESKANLTVTIGAGGGVIDNGGYDVTIAEDISGTGDLIFTGGNTITLTGGVSYSGQTSVTPGTILATSNATTKNNILDKGLVVAGIPNAGDEIFIVTTEGETISEEQRAKVTCPLAPATTFALGESGTNITVATVGQPINYWTGAKDNNLSDSANWSDGNVPTSGNANIFCTTSSTLTKGATFAPDSITFLPGGSVTITGSGLTGITAITNLSTIVQTFACPVTFADNYRVHCDSAPVNFAGGATATYPASDMTDNAASHTLMGNITFTADWAEGKVAYPYTVPNGSVLHGEDARGTDPTVTAGTNPKGDFLSIEVGGKAYFKTVFVSEDQSHINTDGELHVEGVLSVGGSGTYTHATHDQMDTGVIYAGGIHKNSTGPTYIKVPEIHIGKDGIGTGAGYGNKQIYFVNEKKTVFAEDDFEIFGPKYWKNPADWGLNIGQPVTFNTQGHKITWTAGADGANQLIKDGEGTLEFKPYGTNLSGPVTVKRGTLKVMSASGVSTGAITNKVGATLEVAAGATLGTSAVTLEAGSTLALTATGSTFTALDNAVTLPTGADEKAILRIDGDGTRLKSGPQTILSNVIAGATTNVELDGNSPALAGRKASLRVDDKGSLILNIKPGGLVILFR